MRSSCFKLVERKHYYSLQLSVLYCFMCSESKCPVAAKLCVLAGGRSWALGWGSAGYFFVIRWFISMLHPPTPTPACLLFSVSCFICVFSISRLDFLHSEGWRLKEPQKNINIILELKNHQTINVLFCSKGSPHFVMARLAPDLIILHHSGLNTFHPATVSCVLSAVLR